MMKMMRQIKNRYVRGIITVLVIITVPLWIIPLVLFFIGGAAFSDIHRCLWTDRDE